MTKHFTKIVAFSIDSGEDGEPFIVQDCNVYIDFDRVTAVSVAKHDRMKDIKGNEIEVAKLMVDGISYLIQGRALDFITVHMTDRVIDGK